MTRLHKHIPGQRYWCTFALIAWGQTYQHLLDNGQVESQGILHKNVEDTALVAEGNVGRVEHAAWCNRWRCMAVPFDTLEGEDAPLRRIVLVRLSWCGWGISVA